MSRYIVLNPTECTYELVDAPSDVEVFASANGMKAERNGDYIKHRTPDLQVIPIMPNTVLWDLYKA